MSDLWYPAAVRDPAPTASWGTKVATPAKHVLHTTEGGEGVYTPGQGSYFGHNYWPNYTLARRGKTWVVYQHIPANRSGRALMANNRYVTQTEIAAKAAEVDSVPLEAMAALLGLLTWEHRALGLSLTSLVTWRGDEAFGFGAKQRLNPTAFINYSGVLGHQHVPLNDHWDPGAFPINRLLDAGQETSMSAADVQALKDWLWANLVQGSPGHPAAAKVPDIAMLKAGIDGNTLREEDIKGRLDSLGNAVLRICRSLDIDVSDLALDPPGGPTTPVE